SAWSRCFALLVVMLAVSVSVLIVLGGQQLREDAKRSFSHALSGVDLIVGPRGSATELMLYSVFQIGRPSRNMGFVGFQEIQNMPQVRWAVPIQLGDTYQGYPVLGTKAVLFKEFKSQGRGLEWAQGRAFGNPSEQPQSMTEVVLGAEVAQRFRHEAGDQLVLTHGAGGGPEDTDHDDHPLVVVGVLKPTGAPIDRAVLINLEGFEAMHQGWSMGISPKSLKSAAAALAQTPDIKELQPVSLSAVWVGLHNRADVFSVRRKIESMNRDPLMAVLPGVALDELWQVVKVLENSLVLVGFMVAVSAMLGVAAVLLVAMTGRRKELAILRAMGAGPRSLLGYVLLESVLVCLVGIVCGYIVCQCLLWAGQDILRTSFGIMVQPGLPSSDSLLSLGALFVVSVLASLLPAWRAYRLSLMDGLHPPSV
ncbi:MAG: ABC transporter permease, partial [Limnohabitans sp.]